MRPAFAELRESILKDDGSMSKKKKHDENDTDRLETSRSR